jgi:hypothetical protein
VDTDKQLALGPLFERRKEILESVALRHYQLLNRAPLEEDRRAACFEVFVSLLSQRLSKTAMNRILKLKPIEETPFGRYLIQLGEARGMAEGMEEGKIEALQRAVLISASARWRNLPARIEAAIRKLVPSQAERLIRDMAKMSEASELTAWLKAHPARPARRGKVSAG